MRKTVMLILLYMGALYLAGCAQACEGLTAAQCANQGAHDYTRTIEYLDCTVPIDYEEGVSEVTWTFSPEGDSVEFSMLYPDGPPALIDLVEVEPDAYRPLLEEPGESLIRLNEKGFTWIYFDPSSGQACYQVVFSLEE